MTNSKGRAFPSAMLYDSGMIYRAFADTGIELPVIGQGTWRMGESPSRAIEEIAALRLGIDLGMTHIDTAEMYGDGGAEELVGRSIAGLRDRVFLTTKVLPSNASYSGTLKACERSLRRLKTDRVDLYLLHWWSSHHPVEETMRAMHELVASGKVRFVGVSNFNREQLNRAERSLTGTLLKCNQVCYHLKACGIEFSLIPHCRARNMAVVAYSPFGSGSFIPERSKGGRVLAQIGARHGKSPRQVVLNFLTRTNGLFTIPKASNQDHVRENSDALGWQFTAEDLTAMDQAFPPPTRETPLKII